MSQHTQEWADHRREEDRRREESLLRPERCERCSFWHIGSYINYKATYQCRRYPPPWPTTVLDDWCGEWKQR